MKTRIKRAAGRLWKDIWEYKWLGICLIVYYLLVETIFSAFCPLVIVTGFPCPGCGLTRAMMFILTGQFVRAWNINPLIYGWILWAGYIVIQRYWFGRRAKGHNQLLTILAVLMIGVYIYRMICYFPNRPPMTFTGGSLFEKLVPHYGEAVRKLLY